MKNITSIQPYKFLINEFEFTKTNSTNPIVSSRDLLCEISILDLLIKVSLSTEYWMVWCTCELKKVYQ